MLWIVKYRIFAVESVITNNLGICVKRLFKQRS